MSLVSPRPRVREMLGFVNFPKLVPIYHSMEDVTRYEQAIMKSASLYPGVR